MRIIIYSFLIASVLFFVSCSQQKSTEKYTINVTVNGAKDTWAYLAKQVGSEQITVDSTELKSGKAVFTGTLEFPEFYFIKLKDQQLYLPLFVDNNVIDATGSINDIRGRNVTGSVAQEEFAYIIDSMNNYSRQERQLGMEYQQAAAHKDTVLMKDIENQYNQLNTEKSAFLLNYVLEHHESVVGVFVLLNNTHMYDLEELDKVVSSLDPAISGSIYVQELTDKVSAIKKVAIGQPFTDFTLNDPDGNPVSLSSVVGENYILVDFWASWCQPCRAENPNIVEAYNLYHDKGFDVFGVSLDRDMDSWKQAIEDDHLTWTHVSDLQYWNSAAGKLYGVQSIPHNVLIDPDGIIIDKNIRGQDLQDKLAEIFK